MPRVRNRVRLGGHHVPTEDIIRRFYRSKYNFWHIYKNQVHQWYLFYNSENHFHEVVFGENNKFTIVNESVFENIYGRFARKRYDMNRNEIKFKNLLHVQEFLRIGNRVSKKSTRRKSEKRHSKCL